MGVDLGQFLREVLREISLIYLRLSSLLCLSCCSSLIAVKIGPKPPLDHLDPYHLVSDFWVSHGAIALFPLEFVEIDLLRLIAIHGDFS